MNVYYKNISIISSRNGRCAAKWSLRREKIKLTSISTNVRFYLTNGLNKISLHLTQVQLYIYCNLRESLTIPTSITGVHIVQEKQSADQRQYFASVTQIYTYISRHYVLRRRSSTSCQQLIRANSLEQCCNPTLMNPQSSNLESKSGMKGGRKAERGGRGSRPDLVSYFVLFKCQQCH